MQMRISAAKQSELVGLEQTELLCDSFGPVKLQQNSFMTQSRVSIWNKWGSIFQIKPMLCMIYISI